MDELKNKPAPPVWLRWTVLLFISLAMCGNYYIYDSISPLADVLKSKLNFSDSDLGLLQGIYSFPNIIMVLIGGLIIDRIGTKKSTLLFSFFLFLLFLPQLLDLLLHVLRDVLDLFFKLPLLSRKVRRAQVNGAALHLFSAVLECFQIAAELVFEFFEIF